MKPKRKCSRHQILIRVLWGLLLVGAVALGAFS